MSVDRLIGLADIASGDKQVMVRIYREYQSDFKNWMRKMFRLEADDIQEIFQDSVVTLYENVINGKLIELKSSVKTYLFSIGRNKALEYLRKSGRNINLTERDNELLDDTMEEIEFNDEILKKQLLMKSCIRELGETCRSILDFFYFQRLNLSEIKDKLAYKNEESVKSQKFKCMERLRENFLKQYQG